MRTIYFDNGLRPDEMRVSEFNAHMEHYAHKTFIPIINFSASKQSDDHKNAILSTIEAIMARQLKLGENIVSGLKYMVSEYVGNITEHALSPRGYIFAQSYPTFGYLDVCIADNGITLLGSYNALKENEIANDIEAMQAANRGISTKNLPNAENRGYGIITSKKMLTNGLNGVFLMISGGALHIRAAILTNITDCRIISILTAQ